MYRYPLLHCDSFPLQSSLSNSTAAIANLNVFTGLRSDNRDWGIFNGCGPSCAWFLVGAMRLQAGAIPGVYPRLARQQELFVLTF